MQQPGNECCLVGWLNQNWKCQNIWVWEPVLPDEDVLKLEVFTDLAESLWIQAIAHVLKEISEELRLEDLNWTPFNLARIHKGQAWQKLLHIDFLCSADIAVLFHFLLQELDRWVLVSSLVWCEVDQVLSDASLHALLHPLPHGSWAHALQIQTLY